MNKINSRVFIVFILVILMVHIMYAIAFADEEGNQPKEERYIYSVNYFWENYNPEDVGYHVTDPMEKIYLKESEEPLEIRIVKEENEGTLLDHFLDLTVTWVYSDEDPKIINYEQVNTPYYDVTEDEGELAFMFSRENMNLLEYDPCQRYEFLFTFDDGKAYSLIWAADKTLNLEYNEDGHVHPVPPEEDEHVPKEQMGDSEQVTEPTQDGLVQVIADENTDGNDIEGNIPKTADGTDFMWLFIMAASVSGLAAVLNSGNKKN